MMSGFSFNAEEFLARLTAITEANLTNAQFGVSELAREMGMSRSNLHLRVKRLTKKSVSQFINQVRLEKAMEILKQGSQTISETAFDCGFQSVTYFTKCFNDYYGYPPGKVGNRIETENVPDLTSTKKQKKNKRLFAAAATVLFLILVFFVAEISNFLPRQSSAKKNTVKNIAVLPMQFEGSDSMKLIAGGFRESLLNSLMDIENLRVRSETSVEQYRENIKPLKKIAGELNVDYIIEMKGFQKGNEPWLQVNLADAVSDAYLLRESYPLDFYEESFLNLQNQIAGEIVKKTQTGISSREKEILEERLTENPAALSYYLQGLQHLAINGQMETYRSWDEAHKEIFKAKEKFKKAIMLDSGFTAAYVRLGHIYIDKIHYWSTNDKDLIVAYMDSGLVLAEKALSLYEQIPKDRNYFWSLALKSNYYYYTGDLGKSRQFAEKSDETPFPKDEGYYEGKTWKQHTYDNYYGCIENFLNYAEIIPKDIIIYPILYIIFSNSLYLTGFPETADHYVQKFLATSEDTVHYYYSLSNGHFATGNYNDCIKYSNKALEKDSLLGFNFPIMYSYISLNDYANAFKYARILEQHEEESILWTFPYYEIIGFLYQKTDDQKKASEYYSRAVEIYLSQIDSRTPEAAKYVYHFYLAWTYSVMGEKEKALKYLKEVNNRSTIPSSIITYMNDWPLFDNIRNEPEFQKLKKEFEKKYQTEHNRVARLLRERGEIPSASASK
jgi:AraC-like DNA-binding protein/tetratricopeptide (TPR) repeat protein